MDEIVVNFGDSLLRKSDVALLEPGQWLNDNIIGFVMEYLEKIKYKDVDSKIGYIHPSVTQCVKLFAKEEIGILLEPLNICSKDIIFIPLNDSESTIQAGGSHWTLIICDNVQKSFYHLNSLGDDCLNAHEVVSKLAGYITKRAPCLQVVDCPQQPNTADCGMYVVAFIDFLCEKFKLQNGLVFDQNVFNDLKDETLKDSRTKLKNLILNFNENFKQFIL